MFPVVKQIGFLQLTYIDWLYLYWLVKTIHIMNLNLFVFISALTYENILDDSVIGRYPFK